MIRNVDKCKPKNEGHRERSGRVGDVMLEHPMKFVGQKFERYDTLKDPDNYVDMFFNAWGAQYAGGKGFQESAYWLENASFQVQQQVRLDSSVSGGPVLLCHDHLVTTLPENILQAVVQAVAPLRQHVWDKAIPPTRDSWSEFCERLPTVSSSLEEDLMSVVVAVLNCKPHATTLALSVPDRKVVPVHRGLNLLPQQVGC